MWNDGLLRLAAERGLDMVQTARMLAMAHVAGADAIIACFDAKYHCHSAAVVTALDAFFGTDEIRLTLDSRITHTIRTYDRLQDVVNEVEPARVLVGFHFFTSTLQRASLGQKVGRYVTDHYFQPVGCDSFSWLEGRGERCDLSQPAEQPARQTRDQSGPPTLRLEPVTGASPR